MKGRGGEWKGRNGKGPRSGPPYFLRIYAHDEDRRTLCVVIRALLVEKITRVSDKNHRNVLLRKQSMTTLS